MLGVPMLSGHEVVGVIVVWRLEVRAFTRKQVALLTTFADQAVIAIENSRLFNETKVALLKVEQRTAELTESLEYQTAISDVLRVISESPTDVAPVFESILDCAVRLFGSAVSAVYRFDGRVVDLVATRNWPREAIELAHSVYPAPPSEGLVAGRVILSGQALTMDDALTDPAYNKSFAAAGNWRRIMGAPMLKDGAPVGAILVGWKEPGPTPKRQADLLKTFADQAVIAIENVRLFNETQEALERQTATAEILKVIASSPSDVQPVFDAIANSAYRLLGGFSTAVARVVGDELHLVALSSTDEAGNEALKHAFPMPVAHSKAARTAAPVSVSDTEALPESAAALRDVARRRGFRGILIVPMLQDGAATGTISVTRKEPGEFSAHQLELLQSFADQAVIAIQNVRLFNETQEALDRQTATANVLKAISRTTFDLAAVLEVLIGTAARLCRASLGVIFKVEGDLCLASGLFGATHALIEHLAAHPPKLSLRDGITSEAAASGHAVQVEDALTDPRYGRPDVQRVGGYRTLLAVPMQRDGATIGVLTLGRAEAHAFDAKEIELVTSFADQAAIAMENVRLFNETQESLQQQRASAEVLQVISSSVADTKPVFDKILDSCKHLFGGDELDVLLVDEQGLLQIAAYVGKAHDIVAATFPAPVDLTPAGIAIRERRVVHWPDVLGDAPDVPKVLRRMGRQVGYQSLAFAPMLWNDQGIGAIGVARSRGAFSAKELAMLQTFADQAVIAIQNARMFHETQEALERQTATTEVLEVINASPGELDPVFDAIVVKAIRLCDADGGGLWLVDGGMARPTVGGTSTMPPAFAAYIVNKQVPLKYLLGGRDALNRPFLHVTDLRASKAYQAGDPFLVANVELGGVRTNLSVPLVDESGAIVGVFTLVRATVRPFTDKQIALVQAFAAQAQIAMRNARLMNETREALEQQTATAEILRVISESPDDIQPVFHAIVGTAFRLFKDAAAMLLMREGDGFRMRSIARPGESVTGPGPSLVPLDVQANFPSQVILGKQMLHLPDWLGDRPAAARAAGAGRRRDTLVADAAHRAGRRVHRRARHRTQGARRVQRQGDRAAARLRRPGGDRDPQRAAVQRDAEALERQSATADVLQVISGSVSDPQPVFEKILDSCQHLFGDRATRPAAGARRRPAPRRRVSRPRPSRPSSRIFPRPVEDTATGVAIREQRTLHYPDARARPSCRPPPGRCSTG